MTDHQDWEQRPQYPQQGDGQQYPQNQPWQPDPRDYRQQPRQQSQQYDPYAHQQRLGGRSPYPRKGDGQLFQPGYGQQPPQPPYPTQGQPRPQPGSGQQPYPGQPQPQYAPPQPPQGRRKRHTARNVFAGIGGLIVVIIAIIVATSHGSPSSSPGAAAATTPAAAAVSPATCKLQTTFDYIERTTEPGLQPQADEIGNVDLAHCASSLDDFRQTAGQADGECTTIALASDNPGYDPNATPAPALHKIIESAGPGC
jgi:hypothetical protein